MLCVLLLSVLPSVADPCRIHPGMKRPGQSQERITFLINWWEHKPEAPNCDFIDHSKVKGLKLYE
jgi:hypothetical protein